MNFFDGVNGNGCGSGGGCNCCNIIWLLLILNCCGCGCNICDMLPLLLILCCCSNNKTPDCGCGN